MSVELRHSYSHKIFEAKASCATDIKRVISRVIIIQLYCYFSLDSIAWLHILCCAVCGWLGSMYVIYVPYYNRAPNFITFTKICCEFVTSLSFLIAEYLDSSAFLLLFNIFVVPLIGYLSIEIFEWRFKKLENIEFEKIDNYLILELFLRNELSKSEGNLEVIEKFTRFSTNKTRDLGLIAIWECNYCIYSIKDFRLAYIKLAKVSKTGFSVETSFQEYKCFKYLKDNSFDLLEDLNFLNYIFKLTRAKHADRMIAKLYVQFLTEIVSSDPSILVLENFMSGLYRELKSLKRSYESLCTKYPKGNECRKLWTTFNEDIFEYADPLSISRLKFNQTDKILINVINYFDESNGIMLVSAEKETSGTILYVNDQFARLVEGSVHTLTGTQLNNFIPIPYSNDHNFLLIDYANRCKTSAVEFPSSLFLLTERGFLVECYLSISCASLSCHTFYLVLTKKITISRQIAIINEEGLIYDHSENLKFFIKSERAIYRKSFIQEYLTNLDMKSLQASVPHEYKDNLHNFFLIKTVKAIGKSSVIILNFVKDEQGLTEFVELEKTEIVEENDLTLFNTIKNNIEKGKVRFDREDPGDENTEYFHILEEKEKEKTKSDSSGIKLDGIVVSMNKGLFYGIKYVKLFKWMMIGIMLISVCSNAIYIYFIDEQVKMAKNDKLVDYYGVLIGFLLNTADCVNYILLPYKFDIDFLAKMETELNDVVDIEDNIIGEQKVWQKCGKISGIFSDDYLRVYSEYDNLSKMNLHDFIIKFKEKTSSFILKQKSSLDSSEEVKFILENSAIRIVDQLEIDFEEIKICANGWLEDFKTLKNILLIIQIIVVFLYFLLMVYESYRIAKINNFVWNKISESTYHSFYDIRNKCIHRLTSLLDTPEEEAFLLNDCNRVKINNFPVRIRQMWQYLWRIGIFVLISSIYFIMLSMVAGASIEKLISTHNDMKFYMYKKEFLTQKTEFYTISSYVNYFDKNFIKQNFEEIMNTYTEIDSELVDKKYENCYKGNTFDYLFKYYNESISFGLLNNDRSAKLDSYYLYSGNFSEGINLYSTKISHLRYLNLKIIELITKTAKTEIDSAFNNTTTGIIIFSIFYVLIYIFFYWPYFNHKMNQMKKMKKLCRIFVSVDQTSQTHDKVVKNPKKL